MTASVSELAEMIRRREISCVDVVDAYIRRIREVNRSLNALAADRFDAAREEACAADDALAASEGSAELPPLFGVPCTIKEFLAVEGMPQTAGLVSRRDYVAGADATVVERLRDAGAIVLGVTNVPEGGMWMETVNNIYGRTNNPWDVRRTSGGSSGGEAALVAAGAIPFGIGSDIAGSVRIPAAFCGTAAHKPTARIVPNTGHWGAGKGDPTSAFLTCGPICRYVSDLPLLLSIIAGPDGRDPLIEECELGHPSDVAVDDLNVFSTAAMGAIRADTTMRRAVATAVDGLRRAGASVSELPQGTFAKAFQVWAATMSEASARSEAGTFYEVLGEGEQYNVWGELVRSVVGKSRYTFPALALVALERVVDRLPSRFTGGVPDIERMRSQLELLLGDTGVIVLPTYSRVAPRHGAALLTPMDFIFTGIFSVLGFPATQVPTGFDQRGLPVGLQVVAGPGRDHVAMAAAGLIERASGGWWRAEVTSSTEDAA